ncbi:hypothetical protein [Flavobacterium sp.]|uniref:hypothetical protein n=1 Tax=Flavobacterium sp. TaxID=239 RepID=UPI002FD9B07C
MKRILSIVTLLFLINACDDGNLKVDNIDFSDVAAQKCSSKDVIYKVKENKMLFIEIPASVFINDQTPDGVPIQVPISSTVKVTYREYDDAVSANNICPTVPSATPNLREEWTATAGTILITSTAIYTTNATTNATRITGYKYYIVFKDIVFLKPDGTTQTYSGTTFVFGNYTTSVSALAFGFDDQVDKSTCDNRIFNFSGSEAFILDVADYDGLFANAVTTTPRIAYISSANKLTYKLFSNTVADGYFCAPTTPVTPTLSQEWNAVAGVTDVSGIIEVSTTTLSPGFQHTIHLKKVTFKKGNSTFYLGDDIVFGQFVTNP